MLGSTRTMTNTAGAITASYTYTAFGDVLTQTGTPNTDYLYTGQQYDSTTDLYSLRARYYKPSDGRFLNRDIWAYDFQNPVELNRYVYAMGNPISYSDPSGYSVTLGEYGFLARNSAKVLLLAEIYMFLQGNAAYITDILAPELAQLVEDVLGNIHPLNWLEPNPLHEHRYDPVPPYAPDRTKTDDDDNRKTLYHYTDEAGWAGILSRGQIMVSHEEHSKFGHGQYFTDIAPEQIAGRSKRDMTQQQNLDPNLYSLGRLSDMLFLQRRIVDKLDYYIEIDITGLEIDPVEPERHILLHRSPDFLPLDVKARIVRSGVTPFSNKALSSD